MQSAFKVQAASSPPAWVGMSKMGSRRACVGVCVVCVGTYHEFDVAPVGWFWVLGRIGRSQGRRAHQKTPPVSKSGHPKIDLLFPRPGSGPGWLAGRRKSGQTLWWSKLISRIRKKCNLECVRSFDVVGEKEARSAECYSESLKNQNKTKQNSRNQASTQRSMAGIICNIGLFAFGG